MRDEYVLAVPTDSRRWLAIAWLWLGIMALLGSGVFSVLLVLSRTPYLQDVFPWIDFFRTALVVHVDLSVLVWFLAFGGVLWSLNSTPRFMLLGWSAPIEREHGEKEREIFSVKEFVEMFDVKDLNKTNPVFDDKKLEWFNKQYIIALSSDEFKTRFITWAESYNSDHENIETVLANNLNN